MHKSELTINPFEEKHIATAVFLEKNYTGMQSAFVRLTVSSRVVNKHPMLAEHIAFHFGFLGGSA